MFSVQNIGRLKEINSHFKLTLVWTFHGLMRNAGVFRKKTLGFSLTAIMSLWLLGLNLGTYISAAGQTDRQDQLNLKKAH